MKTLPERYQQANKEAKWAVFLALAYFVWWYVFAYVIFPNQPHETLPNLYWGCLYGFSSLHHRTYSFFTLLCALMVKFIYKNMPFDIEEETNHEQ